MSLVEGLLNPPSQPGQTRASRGTGMAGDRALSRVGRRLRADTLRRRSETGGGIRHRPADDLAGRQDLLDQFSARPHLGPSPSGEGMVRIRVVIYAINPLSVRS
jgi:hypothetical protein